MSDFEQHLPLGWIQTNIGEIFAQLRSKVSADSTSPLPFIGMDHVESDTMRLTGMGFFAKMKSAGTHFHPGDILYGRLRPYLNKIYHADLEGVSSAEFLGRVDISLALCYPSLQEGRNGDSTFY